MKGVTKVRFRPRAYIFLLISSATFGINSAGAQIPGLVPEKNWDLNGYVKYMATSTMPDNSSNTLDHLVHQRFNYEYRFNSDVRVNLGMRNRVLWGDTANNTGYGELIGSDAGYLDLTSNWLDRDGVIGTSQFDRAYIQWQNDDWQNRVGRFRVNWAMTTIWNPNDIFNSYSIYDFDYEERSGSDAIAVSRKLGFASSLDLVSSPNEEKELDSYAARYLFNHDGWDYQAMVGKSGLDQVLGAGLAGDVSGAGVRGELSWFNPTQDEWQSMPVEQTTIASLEADYSFGGTRNWIGRVAMLYISKPQTTDSAIKYLNLPLTARTLSFTKQTLYADLGFDISPLSRITFSSIYYQDGSMYFSLNSSYSLSNNVQLLAVAQRFDGRSGSLFHESASTLVFGQIKWSF
ncbi:hypothetical protein [Vibrio tapetis]|uniref:Alginate export domain-containing protein n=1 Tax=Vibrio tapetis subsp. tapetis TaxID=1671868 RepID=A0A2N8Z9Y4_9VIBR|nr:hypothetical protein [Vibrio tapetis]SON48725.1 conserved exported protein of unknown function [Vibrio tapetis subsp. tapetis]